MNGLSFIFIVYVYLYLVFPSSFSCVALSLGGVYTRSFSHSFSWNTPPISQIYNDMFFAIPLHHSYVLCPRRHSQLQFGSAPSLVAHVLYLMRHFSPQIVQVCRFLSTIITNHTLPGSSINSGFSFRFEYITWIINSGLYPHMQLVCSYCLHISYLLLLSPMYVGNDNYHCVFSGTVECINATSSVADLTSTAQFLLPLLQKAISRHISISSPGGISILFRSKFSVLYITVRFRL